jgi:GxxExxY protein
MSPLVISELILVENTVVVELKSVDRFDPVFEAQLLSYMKLGNFKVGLLINFNKSLLKDGAMRRIL